MVNAAYMLVAGRGTLRDFDRALELYQRAARLGNPSAMSQLGKVYEDGKVASRDLVQSYVWYSIAIRTYSQRPKIDPDPLWRATITLWDLKFRLGAQEERLDELEGQMEHEDIIKSQRLAREWKPKTE